MELLSISSKEQFGWIILAQKNLQEIWDNPKDDTVWRRYHSLCDNIKHHKG